MGEVLRVQPTEALGDLGQRGAIVLGDRGLGAGDQLEHAAPPAEFELRADLFDRHPAGAEVLDQLAEAVEGEASQQLGAARERLEVRAVRGEGLDPLLELVEVGAGEIRAGIRPVQQHGELVEGLLGACRGAADGVEVIRQRGTGDASAAARGALGGLESSAPPGLGDRPGLPEVSVEVRGERCRTLQGGGVLAQTAAHAEAHRDASFLAPPLVGGGGDEVRERCREHRGLEGAEQGAHPVEQGESLLELGEGGGLGEAELPAGAGAGLPQLRQDLLAQLVDELFGADGLGVAADRRAIPGGELGAGGEHPDLCRLAQRHGVAVALLADHLSGDVRSQAHLSARRGAQPRQRGERRDGVVRGGRPGLLDAVHRLDVAHQDVAALGELLGRDVLGSQPVRSRTAEAAQQRGGGVALEGRVRREVEDELVQAAVLGDLDQLGEVAPTLGDDQHGPAAGVELLGEVDHEAEARGAGRGGDGEVLTCQDAGEHLAVARLDGGDQVVLRDLGDLPSGLVAAHHGAGSLIPGERCDQRGGGPVGAVGGEILGHGPRSVHQVADHEGVQHAEAGQRLSERTEGVEHRGGVEAVRAVGGGQQRAGVDGDARLPQGTQQHGVQIGGRIDLEVDVLTGVAAQTQGDRAHQHRCVDRGGAVLGVPDRLTDAEVAGGQAHLLRVALGDLADGAGVGSRIGQRPHLPHQGGQAGGTATGQQLGEPRGMRMGQVQHHAAGADLGEEGRGV